MEKNCIYVVIHRSYNTPDCNGSSKDSFYTSLRMIGYDDDGKFVLPIGETMNNMDNWLPNNVEDSSEQFINDHESLLRLPYDYRFKIVQLGYKPVKHSLFSGIDLIFNRWWVRGDYKITEINEFGNDTLRIYDYFNQNVLKISSLFEDRIYAERYPTLDVWEFTTTFSVHTRQDSDMVV